MSDKIEFKLANSHQIEANLCKRLERIRLSRNITQKQLADEAGVSLKTIGRLEQGLGTSLDTFIRVMIALNIQHHLESLLPDPSIRPVERINRQQRAGRKRARPVKPSGNADTWTWGNDSEHKDE